MSLPLIVVIAATGTAVVLGIIGYLIDKSAARHERSRGR